jgi:dTDP-4-dehydrorhamnose 3,5-epimerase
MPISAGAEVPTSAAEAPPIDGVSVRALEMNLDERGSFTEFFRESWPLPFRPRQWSIVASRPRVLRGMHLHLNHDEALVVAKGKVCVGLYDLREDSPTTGRSSRIQLDGATHQCLFFPRGVLHGWYFHDDGVHIQGVSEEYEFYHPRDNLGCHWSDPALGIPWPDRTPVISARAAAFPSLAELKNALRRPS